MEKRPNLFFWLAVMVVLIMIFGIGQDSIFWVPFALLALFGVQHLESGAVKALSKSRIRKRTQKAKK